MDDVLIIGGGPAGSTTAALLAKQGHSVRLFEKEKFPREHVGESLLPFCYPILKELGVFSELEKHFVRKPAVRFLSSDGSTATNWCFNHVIHDESYLSFQVDRKYFDTILLRNAARLGANVREQSRVTTVDFDTDPERVIVTVQDEAGQEETYSGRFLIDASGRSSFIANRNRWRVPDPNLQRTALWTHCFDIAEMKGGLEYGASLIVYLGGDKRGWIWAFPLGDKHLTVGVVLENSYLRERKRAISESGDRDWRIAIFEEELFESPFIKDLLAGARMMDIPYIEGDYSYKSDFKFGSRFAMVGDSGQFIDPIFSSGIYLSMKSATLVSARLHAMLSDGDMDHNRLNDIYETVNGAYSLVKRLIEMYYNPHSITFAEVGRAANQKEHEIAMAAGHYFLSGDFFENQARYQPLLDLLAKPRDFQRFKVAVIDRYDRPHEKCEIDEATVIFPK
ncbi:MAG TPA: NAD(P)/FAD-dependent oxidoreductase [Anaerolineales bacterium]|nr:NAD(P)/FAD-dependent oxidoreductase [Anaerolineales bacterium]